MNIYRFKKLLKNHFENGFYFYFILFLIFTFGIIIGASIIKALNVSTNSTLLRYSSSFFYSYSKGSSSYYSIFKTSIFFVLLYIIISYVIGLLNLGFLVPLLVFIKGGSLGISVGYLIHNYGWKGFLISVFGYYPQNLIYIPCIISIGALTMTISSKYKFSASRKIIRVKRLDALEYTVFLLFFFMVSILGVLYEGFISPIFLNIIIDLI